MTSARRDASNFQSLLEIVSHGSAGGYRELPSLAACVHFPDALESTSPGKPALSHTISIHIVIL